MAKATSSKTTTENQQPNGSTTDESKNLLQSGPEQPAPLQVPTPGRIVTYFPHETDAMKVPDIESFPAMVTSVKDNKLTLTVFGLFTQHNKFNIPHKGEVKETREGFWDWPARS